MSSEATDVAVLDVSQQADGLIPVVAISWLASWILWRWAPAAPGNAPAAVRPEAGAHPEGYAGPVWECVRGGPAPAFVMGMLCTLASLMLQ